MGLFRATADDYVKPNVIKSAAFNRFNPEILGLGKLSNAAMSREAICAMFDLAGFTDFSKQSDPHLEVPQFLSTFLDWLFGQIRTICTERKVRGGVALYAPLPFFGKFMGDGVLFLWDTAHFGDEQHRREVALCNVPAMMFDVCKAYETVLLPKLAKSFNSPPRRLRCGVARGQIHTVGDGKDYVGSCINIAARLQKLSLLPFAFNASGFLVDENMTNEARRAFVLKLVKIRGIGERRVYVPKKEFNALPRDEKKIFTNPE